jgi:tripartite-type tricarboxylate transporter receptor subunit TctC
MIAPAARWHRRAAGFADTIRALAVGFVLLILAAPTVSAEEWTPTRPIRLIAPFAPGGTADILARLLAQNLSGSLAQSVVVENRSGGNTVIATDALMRAAPDGYTVGIISTPFFVTAALMKNLPYNPADVQPLTLLGRISLVLVANPAVPVQTPRDLVNLAQATPLNYGSGGNGTASHLAGALFKLRTNGQFTHVPYRGGGPAMNDLMSGQFQFMFNAVGSTLPFIKSGKFHALAVTGSSRSSALPEVPTMAEVGFPDFDLYESFGLILPPNTPPDIGQRLAREVAKFVRSPQMQKRAEGLGLELVDQSPAEFRQFIDSQMKSVSDIVRGGNIRID